jgi:hypothetical protein
MSTAARGGSGRQVRVEPIVKKALPFWLPSGAGRWRIPDLVRDRFLLVEYPLIQSIPGHRSRGPGGGGSRLVVVPLGFHPGTRLSVTLGAERRSIWPLRRRAHAGPSGSCWRYRYFGTAGISISGSATCHAIAVSWVTTRWLARRRQTGRAGSGRSRGVLEFALSVAEASSGPPGSGWRKALGGDEVEGLSRGPEGVVTGLQVDSAGDLGGRQRLNPAGVVGVNSTPGSCRALTKAKHGP